MKFIRRIIIISFLCFIMLQAPKWVKVDTKTPAEAENATQAIVEPARAEGTVATGIVYQEDLFVKYFGNKAGEAKKIATCESGMNEKATNKNKNKTTDYGIMQINSLWLKVYDITPEYLLTTENNIKVAKNIYDRTGNWQAWVCKKAL